MKRKRMIPLMIIVKQKCIDRRYHYTVGRHDYRHRTTDRTRTLDYYKLKEDRCNGVIGYFTKYCFFELRDSATLYVCDQKH